MNPITETGGAHYYTQTGAARYGATLREARKHNYLPSITTVLQEWPQRSLYNWIAFELLKARHNNPPQGDEAAPVLPGEELSDAQVNYFREVQKKSNAIRDEAAERGNAIHAAAEAMLLKKKWDTSDPALVHLRTWIDENVEEVFWTERALVNLDLKIAGRADALIKTKGDERPMLIDFKGRGFDHGPRKGWRAKRYSKDVVQLAFYASTMTDPPRIANVYVNREGECPVELAEYTDAEREKAFDMARYVTSIWYYEKKYLPEINHDEIIAHMEAVA